MTSRSIILAIETAIGDGSLSVLRGNGTAIGELAGVSRAEHLLIGIDRLLVDCDVSRDEIDMIAVSLGPGSFTGIRVGMATAHGLKASLGTKCVGVTAFDAISLSYPNESMVVVLPLGRGYFAFQEFSRNRASGILKVVNEEELIQTLGNRSDIKIVFHSEAGSAGHQWTPPENFLICTERLSTLIGKCALAEGGTEDMKPLYLRNQGAARNFCRSRFCLIRIRKVAPADIPTIEGIANACKLAPWAASDYVGELSRSDSLFFKATGGDPPCLGFILARIIPAVNAGAGEDAEIYNIGVHPDKQHGGIGSILMKAFLEECRNRSIGAVWLEVRSGNAPAIDFYSKHKFEVVAARRAFYRDPVEDAIVMRSRLYNPNKTEA